MDIPIRFFHQGVDLNPPLSFTGLAGKTIGGDQVVKMNTYVNFRVSCAEAFRYYEKHLGAKVGMMMTHVQSPDQSLVKPEWKDAVLHARITIGDTELMAADIPNAEPMRSAYLTLRVDSDSKDTLHFYSPGAKPVSREDAPVSCYGTPGIRDTSPDEHQGSSQATAYRAFTISIFNHPVQRIITVNGQPCTCSVNSI